MYQTGTDTTATNSDSRIVADILSSMANGEGLITPTTLSVIEGFCTGIPTRTTPTLTPTTLRSLEQTFMDFQNIGTNEEHEHQAGFVPPVVPAIRTTSAPRPTREPISYQSVISTKDDQVPWCGEQTTITPPPPPVPKSRASNPHNTRGRSGGNNTGEVVKKRGTGGRRPRHDMQLSPEEEERRSVRRERNKLAAARCRKRRMDHTSSLVDETDGLEEKKYTLQQEIQALQNEKEDLEFILEAHRSVCKLKASGLLQHYRESPPVKVKVEPACYEPQIIRSSSEEEEELDTDDDSSQDCISHHTLATSRPQLSRPTTLSILSTYSNPSLKLNTNMNSTQATGIPIQTPSVGIFNFDALMDGGTGLTPVTSGLTPIIPNCSGQQRHSHTDLASPDSKLVSL